jgi:protein SCO1
MTNRLTVPILITAALASISCHRQQLPVLSSAADFVLTDHNGQRFALSSLRGKAVLLFFGFTSCPDACPTTLSKLSAAYRELGPEANLVKTLYITVDPQRDSPAVLKADLASFRVDALGLTGTKSEIDKVVSMYGASYEFVPTPDSAAEYTVAHTALLFALDTAGRTRIRFSYEATVDEIAAGVRAILAARD